MEAWSQVIGPLESLGTIVAYDRLGIGGSSKPAVPQAGDVMVQSLRELLREAGLAPPYVLVGHSLGGLIANLYARMHPGEVSAAVFLDAAAPEDASIMAAHRGRTQRALQRALDAVFGKDALGEAAHVDRTVTLIAEAGPFPDIPLVVVTGARPALSWLTPASARAARAEHQRRLAALSPRGRQLVASRSGHFPQVTEPDVVVRAVREAGSAVRPAPTGRS